MPRPASSDQAAYQALIRAIQGSDLPAQTLLKQLTRRIQPGRESLAFDPLMRETRVNPEYLQYWLNKIAGMKEEWPQTVKSLRRVTSEPSWFGRTHSAAEDPRLWDLSVGENRGVVGEQRLAEVDQLSDRFPGRGEHPRYDVPSFYEPGVSVFEDPLEPVVKSRVSYPAHRRLIDFLESDKVPQQLRSRYGEFLDQLLGDVPRDKARELLAGLPRSHPDYQKLEAVTRGHGNGFRDLSLRTKQQLVGVPLAEAFGVERSALAEHPPLMGEVDEYGPPMTAAEARHAEEIAATEEAMRQPIRQERGPRDRDVTIRARARLAQQLQEGIPDPFALPEISEHDQRMIADLGGDPNTGTLTGFTRQEAHQPDAMSAPRSEAAMADYFQREADLAAADDARRSLGLTVGEEQLLSELEYLRSEGTPGAMTASSQARLAELENWAVGRFRHADPDVIRVQLAQEQLHRGMRETGTLAGGIERAQQAEQVPGFLESAIRSQPPTARDEQYMRQIADATSRDYADVQDEFMALRRQPLSRNAAREQMMGLAAEARQSTADEMAAARQAIEQSELTGIAQEEEMRRLGIPPAEQATRGPVMGWRRDPGTGDWMVEDADGYWRLATRAELAEIPPGDRYATVDEYNAAMRAEQQADIDRARGGEPNFAPTIDETTQYGQRAARRLGWLEHQAHALVDAGGARHAARQALQAEFPEFYGEVRDWDTARDRYQEAGRTFREAHPPPVRHGEMETHTRTERPGFYTINDAMAEMEAAGEVPDRAFAAEMVRRRHAQNFPREYDDGGVVDPVAEAEARERGRLSPLNQQQAGEIRDAMVRRGPHTWTDELVNQLAEDFGSTPEEVRADLLSRQGRTRGTVAGRLSGGPNVRGHYDAPVVPTSDEVLRATYTRPRVPAIEPSGATQRALNRGSELRAITEQARRYGEFGGISPRRLGMGAVGLGAGIFGPVLVDKYVKNKRVNELAQGALMGAGIGSFIPGGALPGAGVGALLSQVF